MSSTSAEPAPTLDVPYASPHIAYAPPTPSYGNKVFAACAVICTGLGLLLIGGCFLIGVMMTTTNGFSGANPPLRPAAYMLMAVLYLLAGVTFVAASFVIVKGISGLFHIMRA